MEAEVLVVAANGSKGCVFCDGREEEGAYPWVGGKLLLEGKKEETEEKREEEELRRRSRAPPA